MGCLKLTYHQGEALENSPLFIEKGLEKNDFAAKKCFNYYPYGKVLRMLQFEVVYQIIWFFKKIFMHL